MHVILKLYNLFEYDFLNFKIIFQQCNLINKNVNSIKSTLSFVYIDVYNLPKLFDIFFFNKKCCVDRLVQAI